MDCDTGDNGPWQPAACVPCVELVVDQGAGQQREDGAGGESVQNCRGGDPGKQSIGT